MENVSHPEFSYQPFTELLKDWRPAQVPPPNKRPVLKEDKPYLLQLRITLDQTHRVWECYAGAAGAGKFLNHFTGRIPQAAIHAGPARVITSSLNEASKAALKRFKGAKVVSITIDGEHVAAPIARLEMATAAPQSQRGGDVECPA